MIKNKPLKISLVIISLFFLIWVGGFLYFISNFENEKKTETIFTEGIVVFTGSPGRIMEGIRLLENKNSNHMLVTGVNKSTVEDTRRWIKSITTKYDCCVELETKAKNTYGNARATVKWIDKHNIKSLTLVTASYHISRSKVVLQRLSPNNLIILKNPVADTNLQKNLKQLPAYLLFIATEYCKFLISLFQLRLGI